MNSVQYALACVVFPVLWGLVVAWLSNRIKGARSQDREHRPTIASDDIA